MKKYLKVHSVKGGTQWLICKEISVGTPSAEGARIEAPQAPRGVGCGEGVSLSPPGEGSGEGAMPPPEKNFEIFTPKWWVLVQYEVIFATFHSLLLHANWNFNSTQYPTINSIIPFTLICLTYGFCSVKPAAYGFWLLVVPFLYHSVIPLNFAISFLHNADVGLPWTIAIGCRA